MLTLVTRTARLMALLGGFALTALVAVTCASILGRGIDRFGHWDRVEAAAPGLAAWLTGFGPVRGDYELVEAGIAFAVFSFLPICQLMAAHATVDVFTGLMPARVNRFLAAFWEIVLAFVIILIGWRLYAGFLEKLDNGQTSFLLQFPVWWAYGASLVAAIVAGLVGLYCAAARVAEGVTGRPHLPGSEGSGH
ncbi:TRAP transporter small permease [Roseicyclus marinus]|nr:TRAP transporter small permease [Roseicyclus marinus]MDG3040257.1 TRAP transporter small permease [Roseicyclus marinus]